jgi:peptidoglycan/LPS O-acetylase OafA/YrhL
LDGLRAVAIAVVVLVHAAGLPYGGVLGVDLFFVLSGFLITTLLLEELADTGRVSLKGFYARRARRLFPALAVLLAFYVVVATMRGENGWRVVALGGLYSGNVVQAFVNPDPILGHGLDHLWSLGQEEQFYLLWPILLALLARSRRLVLWLALITGTLVLYRIGLVLTGARHMRLYMGPDTHADGLTAGALLGALRFARGGLTVPEWVGKSGGAAFLAAVILRPESSYWEGFGLPFVELACVMLVAAAVGGTDLARVLAWRPLVWVGVISYSLYLWHYVIVWLFGLDSFRPWYTIPLSVVAAWLSYRFVEQPFRRRRSRLAALPARA